MGDLREWAGKNIGSLLQMPPEHCDEIVENILAYTDASELCDFLGNFAETTAEHRISSFVTELFERKNGGGQKGARQNKTSYSEPVEEPGREKGGKDKGKGRGRGKGNRDDDTRRRREKDDFPKMLMPTLPKADDDRRLMVIDAASGRHKILTNCINCGKVIAEEEGWGPCLFCGNPLDIGGNYGSRMGDDRGYKEAGPAAEQEKFNSSFEAAKATKDRLLLYDRDAKKRTKVYDDATDWYSEANNPWLTEKQREEASRKGVEEERKKREEKRKIHAKIDLFGRTVIDASAEVEAEMEKENKASYETWTDKVEDEHKLMAMYEKNQKGMGSSQLSGDSQHLYDMLRASLHETGKKATKSQFAPAEKDSDAKKSTRWDASNDASRVEDEFSSVTTSLFAGSSGEQGPRLLPVEESPYGDSDDTGACLSMHQPWASLLVHGFKRAEGRPWKHEHRGRLWIHAASKVPEPEQIEMLEQQYFSLYDSQGIPMPSMPSKSGGYPTSALLGCVDVEACWPQDEYLSVLKSNPSMPPEENGSDFIFWCLRPRRLIVPQKMGGDYKIWKLPSHAVKAAQRGLQPVRWPAPSADQSLMSSPDVPRRSAGSTWQAGGEEEPYSQVATTQPAAAARAAPSTASAAPETAAAVAAPSAASAAAKAAQRAKVAPPRPRGPPRLDLWPAAENAGEVLQIVERDRDRDVVVVQDGFVVLVGFVPVDIQQRIIDEMRELGVSEKGFFAEQSDGIKVSNDVQRMYLGMHWDAVARKWNTTRNNLDGEPAPPVPKFFLDMYDDAVKRANRELTRGPNKKRKLAPMPEGKAPSLAVINFFQPTGTMQIHQDRGESPESIAAGHAVMGICIGDSCDFAYGTDQPTAAQKPKSVRLESGDVYLFGGSSRMLWHGVTKVQPRSAPPSLRLAPGRLNVTMRVY